MLETLNYEEILIVGISSGMTMALVSRILSSSIYIFKQLLKDCTDV